MAIHPGAAFLPSSQVPENTEMASITITDLPVSRALDVHAMTSLRGAAGAPWVHGFRAPIVATPAMPMVLNYYETNNFTFIDKMVNQVTNIDVDAGDNSPVTAVVINSLNS
ncbi:MAG: hypothetical protein KIT60_30635 [Burkholderiaceae bacterium]|nr:hypothetical protein [Burkholderiaceae bacterium]